MLVSCIVASLLKKHFEGDISDFQSFQKIPNEQRPQCTRTQACITAFRRMIGRSIIYASADKKPESCIFRHTSTAACTGFPDQLSDAARLVFVAHWRATNPMRVG